MNLRERKAGGETQARREGEKEGRREGGKEGKSTQEKGVDFREGEVFMLILLKGTATGCGQNTTA